MLWRLWQGRPRILNNPVVMRELLVQLRKPGSFIQLFLFLCILSGWMIYFWAAMRGEHSSIPADQAGRVAFYVLSSMMGLIVALFIPIFSATQINVERERDTWEMLISSPVNMASILFGKWLSSILYVWLMLASMIPAFSLMMTSGGISPQEITFLFVMITEGTAVVSLLGIICSIRYKKPMTAIISTYVLVFAYFFLLPYIGMIKYGLYEFYHWQQTPFLLGLPVFTSPFLLSAYYFNRSLQLPGEFIDPWCSIHPFMAHGIAFGFMMSILIGWALWGLHRLRARDERRLISIIRRVIRKRERARRYSKPFEDAELYSDLRNPLAQKDLRELYGPYNMKFWCNVAALFVLGMLFLGSHYDRVMNIYYFALVWREYMPYVILWIFPLFLLPYAAGSIRGEHDNRTWDLLRTTTLTPWQIVWGKMMAGFTLFQWRFWAFYGLPFLIGVLTTGFMAIGLSGTTNTEPANHFNFVVGSCLVMLASAFFYTAVGVFFSSRVRTTARAFSSTFISVFLLFTGFWIVAALFGKGRLFAWELWAGIISPLRLCFSFRGGWVTSAAIQIAFTLLLACALLYSTKQRISRGE